MFVPTLLPDWFTVKGRPERHAQTPDAIQSLAKTFWPSGRSTTKLVVTRWRTS